MGLPTNKHRRSDKDREAYLAGRLAREQGRAIGANPHATGTAMHREWSRGWRKADKNATSGR
jgi:hypothetical protein